MDVTNETLDKDGEMNYENFDQFTFEYDATHYSETVSYTHLQCIT